MSIVGGGNTSMLQVTIASARGLPAKDINGLSDPYCKFYWKGQKYKSSVQKKTLSPKWNEIFLLPFDVVQGPFQLHIEIWDYDTFGSNEYMATCELDLSSISATSEASEGQYKLQGPGASGVLNLKLQLLKSPLPKKEHNTGQLSHSSHAQLKASTQVVVQSHQSPPAAVHLYPSLSPPAAVPPQRPPPPYPSNIVGNGEHNTVSSVPPGDLKAVKEILPQCSYNQISEYVNGADYNFSWIVIAIVVRSFRLRVTKKLPLIFCSIRSSPTNTAHSLHLPSRQLLITRLSLLLLVRTSRTTILAYSRRLHAPHKSLLPVNQSVTYTCSMYMCIHMAVVLVASA
eukprot:GHVQ01019247.1.p1 GENE.GHVQ01019247.1~~GHVQ01019247.1.p1  ORF type:complete len:342 (+),score=28.28 GHVQ01019247.1:109-1134(+)